MSRADLVARVRAGQRFLVTCHVRPDADALGSALGFAAGIRALGKTAVVYSHEGTPRSLTFLEGSDDVVGSVPEGRFDATVVMDTAARELLPPLPPPERSGPLVVVDHHTAHDGLGDIVVREVDACATGELVLRVLADLGLSPPPRESAQPIYAAIVADTGGFRYSGTRPETLRLGAMLLELGVDPWLVASNLFERWTAPRMLLLGEVLRATRVESEGRVAMVCVDRATLEASGASDDMLEGLVNYGRMLEGVMIAALLWEPRGRTAGEVKLSLRGATGADVSKVAVALGGGGHRAAAGATLAGPLDAARARVLAEIEKALAAGSRAP